MNNNIPTLELINNNFIILPTPSPITYSWNMGSLLGSILSIQILTGFFISIHYSPSLNTAFNSYIEISRDLNQGFMLKFSHSTGATLFFALIFTHIFRSLCNKSYNNSHTWISGFLILITLIATAFIGYVLPWGQISLWGATVITNLLSTVPIIGNNLTYWLWGSFSVENPTLNRFFSIHFLTPFVLAFLSIIHISILHQIGSSSNLNLNSNNDNISFNNFFTFNDITSFIIIIFSLLLLSNSINIIFLDPENFIPANPLSTPNHIIPEWYFLFAYAILRSIPSNLGGVLALLASLLILLILPLLNNNNSSNFNPLINISNFLNIASFIVLTFLGNQVIEEPFAIISNITSIIYFLAIINCF